MYTVLPQLWESGLAVLSRGFYSKKEIGGSSFDMGKAQVLPKTKKNKKKPHIKTSETYLIEIILMRVNGNTEFGLYTLYQTALPASLVV